MTDKTISHAAAEDRHVEALNDIHGTVQVAGRTFDAAEVLQQLDPIAFRESLNQYLDSLERDGWTITD